MTTEQNEEARPLACVLYRQMALDADGRPLPTTTLEDIDAAEAAHSEWVAIGALKMLVVGIDDAERLARATGALVEGGPPTLCLRMRHDVPPDQLRIGDLVAIDSGEAGVPLLFAVWWTGADFAAPVPEQMLGGSRPQDWARDEALALGLDEVLLVQDLVHTLSEEATQ